jgi:hypothetical protein
MQLWTISELMHLTSLGNIRRVMVLRGLYL